DVRPGNFLDFDEHVEERWTASDDVAELAVLELLRELVAIRLELIEEQRVLQDERRLTGKDGQNVQARLFEQAPHVVVADVEDAEELTLRDERRAHDAREPQVHDTGARA